MYCNSHKFSSMTNILSWERISSPSLVQYDLNLALNAMFEFYMQKQYSDYEHTHVQFVVISFER